MNFKEQIEALEKSVKKIFEDNIQKEFNVDCKYDMNEDTYTVSLSRESVNAKEKRNTYYDLTYCPSSGKYEMTSFMRITNQDNKGICHVIDVAIPSDFNFMYTALQFFQDGIANYNSPKTETNQETK